MEEEPHCRLCCARTLVVGKPAAPPAARPARPKRKASRRARGGSCSRLRLLVIWLSFSSLANGRLFAVSVFDVVTPYKLPSGDPLRTWNGSRVKRLGEPIQHSRSPTP